MRKDHDPEKRRMKGQTEVKHEILKKYLKPWMFKITEVNKHIRYIDGFAGWGQYDDGSPGSPLIAIQVVQNCLENGNGNLSNKLDTFSCTFIEKDPENYSDLESAVEQAKEDSTDKIQADCLNRAFDDFAADFIRESSDPPSPTFIFIDPFGFSGLPFAVVKDLMKLRTSGVEVFINFMSGKMARFIGSKTHESAIDEILGTSDWRNRIDENLSRDEKAEEFVKIYEEQLRNEAHVDYVWPFEMKKEQSRQTNYYLVHATNHFDGHRLMKDIMYNTGAEEQFAYLGPDHYPYLEDQSDLSSFGENDQENNRKVQDLADYLHDKFSDKKLTFYEIMKESYQETVLIQKHYREACYNLRDQKRAKIVNHPDSPNGTKTGLGEDDEIRFVETTSLNDFL